MLATPALNRALPRTGARPINLSKDRKQVVELLNLTFGRRGQRLLGEQVRLNDASPLLMRWNVISRAVVPGFVWEESGTIVGNVTLLETLLPGRYMIANVAVHPDHLRRGIARALMLEAINYITHNRGTKILLQVEEDNQAAINLYQTLDFDVVGTMNHWHVTSSRLKVEHPTEEMNLEVRKLDRHDWSQAYHLDRLAINPDLNWPVPPTADFFKTGLWRRLTDLLNGQSLHGWVAEDRSSNKNGKGIVGLVTIFSDWGRPQQIRLRIKPAWQGQLEEALLYRVLTPVKKQSIGTALISHPSQDQTTNGLLAAANFQLRRALTIMVLEIANNDDRRNPLG